VVRTIGNLELAGNVLCLDFANTVNSRLHQPAHDYLASYQDLLEWSRHARSLTPQAIRRLGPLVATAQAAKTLTQAHRLRDTIYEIFSAIAHGRTPRAADLDALSEAYRSAMGRSAITRQDSGPQGDAGQAHQVYEVIWPAEAAPDLAAALWPVSHSAGELLLSGSLGRLGECPGCGWLFLDTSRNGGRRWCSMATCGSRDKMARYHRQQRKADAG
jgi:predicted RNA-binding Zn ribbon-like protein